MSVGKDKTKIGLWIDHRKAVMVFISGHEIEKKIIKSNVEKQLGRINGLRSVSPYEWQMVLADDTQERIFTSSIEKYYNKVYLGLKDAESVLIVGPGEAKGELKKYIEKKGSGNLVIGVESVDNMTDRQIIAKVKRYFQNIDYSPSRA